MESLNTIPANIQNIEDKEVRTRVLNSIKELQAQMQSLQTTHPYIQEERDFYTRQEIKRAHKETILQDIQLCQTHNPKAEMEFIKQSLDKDSEDKGLRARREGVREAKSRARGSVWGFER